MFKCLVYSIIIIIGLLLVSVSVVLTVSIRQSMSQYQLLQFIFLDSYIIQLYFSNMFVLSHTLHNVYIQSRSITFYLCLSV